VTCDEAREATLDRTSLPLDPERERELAAHLGRCGACRDHAAEIEELEDRIADTLASVANTDVARRFKPRSRWAPLAAAAAVALACVAGYAAALPRVARPGAVLAGKGVFAVERAEVSLAEGARAVVLDPGSVRLESGRARFRALGDFQVRTTQGSVDALGTEFTVEVEEDRVKQSTLALGASVVVVGVVSGAVILRMNDGQEAALKAGDVAVGRADAAIQVLAPAEVARKQAEAQKRITELELSLASSEARAASLASELAAVSSAAGSQGPPPAGKSAPATPGPVTATAAPQTPDERVQALVKGFDWKTATRALATLDKIQARGSGEKVDPSIYLALSQMNVLAGQIARERGYSSPWQAYSDPTVTKEFLPAYLDAMGTNLDANQVEAVRAHLSAKADVGTDDSPPQGDAGYLGEIKGRLAEEFKFQQFLGTLLRPDQAQNYDDFAGDDPFFGQHNLRRSDYTSTGMDELVQNVLSSWKQTFDLSPPSLTSAQAVAQKYVQAAVSIPCVDPTLDIAARRTAGFQRAISMIELQEGMESELAALPGLSDAERGRVQKGSGTVCFLQLKK
jgi:predicted anti-sigma-YlaC factor YlaD